MTHLEFLEKAYLVKKLTNKRNTGTPSELAQRINISERSLSRLIKTLKENNYPIRYCRTKQSYIID
jgi:DNA-binding MarR family transcriptional regulator